jgi:hypothetical protein
MEYKGKLVSKATRKIEGTWVIVCCVEINATREGFPGININENCILKKAEK